MRIKYPLDSMTDDAREAMEEEVLAVLKKHGWEPWASGAHLEGERTRDIALDQTSI